MTYNIFWAALLAISTGIVINGFTAGLLSQGTKLPWKDIWLRLTSVLLLVVSITIMCSLISTALWAVIVTFGLNIAVIWKTRLLKSHQLVSLTGWLVAAVSFLIGQSAATGNIVQAETFVLLGLISGVLVGGILGVLHLLTKKSGQVD